MSQKFISTIQLTIWIPTAILTIGYHIITTFPALPMAIPPNISNGQHILMIEPHFWQLGYHSEYLHTILLYIPNSHPWWNTCPSIFAMFRSTKSNRFSPSRYLYQVSTISDIILVVYSCICPVQICWNWHGLTLKPFANPKWWIGSMLIGNWQVTYTIYPTSYLRLHTSTILIDGWLICYESEERGLIVIVLGQ